MTHLTSSDLVHLTRISHSLHRLVTILLPSHIIELFGPGCLNQKDGLGSILLLLYVLEKAVLSPEYGSIKKMSVGFVQPWEVQENSKFKYQLVAVDSILGLQRALAQGCKFHPHMANCVRSVAMCEYLLSKGVEPTNRSLTLALSNDCQDVANWMIKRGLVACPIGKLKLSRAIVGYTLTRPRVDPAFIRCVARVANAHHDYVLARSLLERYGIHSADNFLPMTMKAPLDFIQWVLTLTLFRPEDIMTEAIKAQRWDVMKLVPMPVPSQTMSHVTHVLVGSVAEFCTLEVLEWALQQNWGCQSFVVRGAVMSGDISKVRLANQHHPIPDNMGDVALQAPHCNVEILQYLADRKRWPSRELVIKYIQDSQNRHSSSKYLEVVAWLKRHYWWV
jgi:hypothetical protein